MVRLHASVIAPSLSWENTVTVARCWTPKSASSGLLLPQREWALAEPCIPALDLPSRSGHGRPHRPVTQATVCGLILESPSCPPPPLGPTGPRPSVPHLCISPVLAPRLGTGSLDYPPSPQTASPWSPVHHHKTSRQSCETAGATAPWEVLPRPRMPRRLRLRVLTELLRRLWSAPSLFLQGHPHPTDYTKLSWTWQGPKPLR